MLRTSIQPHQPSHFGASSFPIRSYILYNGVTAAPTPRPRSDNAAGGDRSRRRRSGRPDASDPTPESRGRPANAISLSALRNRSTGPIRATIDTADTTSIPRMASRHCAPGTAIGRHHLPHSDSQLLLETRQFLQFRADDDGIGAGHCFARARSRVCPLGDQRPVRSNQVSWAK